MGRTRTRAGRSRPRLDRRFPRWISWSIADDSFGVRGDAAALLHRPGSARYYGVEEKAVYDTIGALVGGVKIGFSQRGSERSRSISQSRCSFGDDLSESILATPLPAGGTARQGANVDLAMW